MGLEAPCTATLGDARSQGKALLETTELVFRGDFRVRVPLGEVTRIEADAARLVVGFGGQTLTLTLGAAAARWAEKMRNPPGRLDKLGVKPTTRVAVVGQLSDDFLGEVEARAAEVTRGLPRAGVDVLFYAAGARADLARLAALRARIAPDGAIWVIRPKGRPEITERDVMQAGKAAGMVDVKVASFSPTHTAEKFVIPLADRTAHAPAKPAKTTKPKPAKPITPSRATAKSLPPRRSRSSPR